MTEKLKQLFSKYKHVIWLSYWLLYVPWFSFLNEYTPMRDPYVIYTPLDSMIPFSEFFVIPYFVWFAYVAAGYVFLFLVSRSEFTRMCIFLYGGMTVSLIIYTVFPNCQQLRIDYASLGRDNLLIDSIRSLQSMDTPCNVFPSIHVLNSIGMHTALARSKHLGRHKNLIIVSSFVLIILIILSTVFVKQHSILDVLGALVLSIPLYIVAYRVPYKRLAD